MARGPHHHHLLIHGLILTPASSTYIHKYMKKEGLTCLLGARAQAATEGAAYSCSLS